MTARDRDGDRVVAGRRAVAEALRSAPEALSKIVADEGSRGALAHLLEDAERARVTVELRPRRELDRLARGTRHQGVLALCRAYDYATVDQILQGARAPALVLALDQITDPHNFGALVRSAVALGADGVITLADRASPVTPVVVRASAGATEHAPIARVTNLARTLGELSERGLEIVGLDGDGETAIEALGPAPGGRVLVVGSEGHGLRRLVRERCDLVARIELRGPIASLNASVAGAIALWEAAKAR